MDDSVFRAGADYVSRGWRVLWLHGIRADGSCTCGNPLHTRGGALESQCGKHPVHAKWQESAATDEVQVAAWFESTDEPINIGVQLGPLSGIVDIEYDDETARLFAEKLGILDIETPTFSTGGRSEHRIFLWDDRLKHCRNVMKPGGLECRLGANGGTQSVFPASRHWSGSKYAWKPGFSPDDVPVAPLPDSLMRLLVVDEGVAAPTGKPPANGFLFGEPVGEGHRHHKILSYATKLAFEMPNWSKRTAEIKVLISAVNATKCVPPKTEDEIDAILASVFEYRRRHGEQQKPLPKDEAEFSAIADEIDTVMEAGETFVPATGSFALHGLEYRSIPGTDWQEWCPGKWSIKMVHSDPPEIVLVVPAWASTACGGKVSMSLSDFRSAATVAKKVFEATRSVFLDGDTEEWLGIWRGQKAAPKIGRPRISGLCEKLLEKKQRSDDVHVGVASLRFAALAGYLLEILNRASRPHDDQPQEPSESGRQTVLGSEYWFKWSKVWDELRRSHDVAEGERLATKNRLCRIMGVTDLPHRRWTFPSGEHQYVVFDEPWMAALRGLANGEISL